MQSFKFRLERVLQWQAKVCRMKEEEVNLCHLALHEAEEVVARLEITKLSAEQAMRSERALPGSELQAWERHCESLVRKARDLEAQRQALAAVLDNVISQMMAERRRLRQIEMIRHRALREHTLAADRDLETLALECHLSRWIASAANAAPPIPGAHDRPMLP